MRVAGGSTALESDRRRLDGWYEKATVRGAPRRVLDAREARDKLFFRPELVPIVAHPLVVRRGPETCHRLLVRHLLHYLEFTDHLEHDVVNQVTHALGRGRLPFDLPAAMKLDAYKIYVDEAYHSLFSADLETQIIEVTGIEPAGRGSPRFLERLEVLEASAPSELRHLIRVFFAVISETLISSTLVSLPGDRRVVAAVREMIADHARDEAVHHVYFARLLGLLWPRLKDAERAYIGPLLPDLMLAFLEPDQDSITFFLASEGFSVDECRCILADCYPRDRVLDMATKGGAAAIHHFTTHGLFEDERIVAAFERSGLNAARRSALRRRTPALASP